MNENVITIKNLNKFYGRKQTLFDLNLTIRHGMFGLLGRNGAGKTTLMKTIATLLHKKDGEIIICGVPVENAKEVRKLIGYLPQEFSMYGNMTIKDTLHYLGTLSGMTKQDCDKQINYLLGKVNLNEHSKKKVKALSGGMKRRLGIAQALLHDPKVLIVDEPTVGLDPEERIRFRNLLCEIAEERIVILSTHIVGDIEATCEDIAILNDGRLLFSGKVDSLLDQAQGKVYIAEVTKGELLQVKQNYMITSMHTQGKNTQVRFLSDVGVKGAAPCSPNIEDAYMFCLHKNGIHFNPAGGEAI